MDEILTVSQLIEQLQQFPPDALVMTVVVKYPGEFTIKPDVEGNMRWDTGSDVEVRPLEEEPIMYDNQVWIVTELDEWNEERAMLNGAGAHKE